MYSDFLLPRLLPTVFLLWHFVIPDPVLGNGNPPTARIDMDPQRPNNIVYDGETIFFDGSASSDNDESGNYIAYYEWWINGVYHGGGSTKSYQFTLGSTTQTVKLRVKDDENQWGEKTITLTVTTRPKRYYYLKDHLGSVRVTLNENGDVVHYDDYYPFGLQMPQRSMEEDGPKERFTGHEKDGETGLYYAGARFVDPVIGRWMSVDPLAAGGPSISPYVYSFNDPFSFVDPDGAWPFTFHIQSFHPNASFGASKLFGIIPTSSFSGDNRGFTLSREADARVRQLFTIEADNGELSGRSLFSNLTRRISDGAVRLGRPVGGIAKEGSPGNWDILSQYSSANPLTPVFSWLGLGDYGPAIDIIGSLNVSGGQTGDSFVTFSGQLFGDDYPNTQISVADASGAQLFLGVDVRSGQAHTQLPGGPTANVINFNVTASLTPSGNFGRVHYLDKWGRNRTMSVDDWNALFENTDADRSDH